MPVGTVLLGALVARELGVGLVEVRKNPRAGDRVVLVDDWIATGGQALGAQRLVDESGATWLGAAVIVDALTEHQTRRALELRSLLHERDLG